MTWFCLLSLIGAMVVSTPATAQDADVVPYPSGGASDFHGVVPPAGAAPTTGQPAASPVAGGDATRLHVKFAAGAGPVLVDGTLALDDAEVLDALERAGAAVEPLFDRSAAAIAASRRQAEAASGRAQPDLSRWYLVTATSSAAGASLAWELQASDVVDIVQAEPTLAITQVPDEEVLQGYLDNGPTGVGAEWAWGRPGGTGQNVRIVAIDSGFDTDHDDLDRASAPGVAIPHAAAWDTHHGLQVLGILAADDDAAGAKGIAYGAALNTVTSGRTASDMANALDLATAATGPGDVITISQGICAVSGCGGGGVVLPLVYSASARDALRVATAKGVITVISAGNGGANLDSYADRLGSDAPDVIVVGAGNGAASGCSAADGPARGRVSSSNYGSRVDLHGWGSCVRTTAQGGGYRWWGFTSAATPQVAGAAALFSSMAQAQGTSLSLGQIKALLEATGSAQTFSGTRGGRIGPLPDVRAALDGIGELPTNDAFAAATVVDRVPFVGRVDARLAGVEADEPAVSCGEMSNTVWFRYTPTSDVRVTITTEGSTFDTLLGLWRDQPGGLERVACGDDRTVNDPDAAITATLAAGSTFYVQAGGAGGDEGRLRVAIHPAGYRGVGCDIDDDGQGEVVAGSPGEDLPGAANAGRALVVYGDATAAGSATSVTQEWPGVAGRSERGDRFGTALACGDFDGDGHDDLAVGSPREGLGKRSQAGAVRIIHGSPSGLTSRSTYLTQSTTGIRGTAERGDLFGSALASGDFDGDGIDDLAIGSRGEDVGGVVDAGEVHVVYGTDGGLRGAGSIVLRPSRPALPGEAGPGARFGSTLAAGDLDGNGFDELLIGAPSADVDGVVDAGRLLVLFGSADGVTVAGARQLTRGADGAPGSPGRGDRFGHALATGDIDRDGFDDLAVGVPGADVGGVADAGLVLVFAGSVFGPDTTTATVVHQDVAGVADAAEPGDGFGTAVSVGDVTGDRRDDVVVGAPGEDVGGAADAGGVHVFKGSAGGLTLGSGQRLTQQQQRIPGRSEAGDGFGSVVGTVDTNGDGRRDLMIGVPGENLRRVADVGLVLVVPGGENGVVKRRADELTQRSLGAGRGGRNDRFGVGVAAS